MSVTTTTGKPIGDYEDYHTEDGQPIADVSYFEQDAVIPLSGKYSLSDAKKTTKSVKLSTVIGGGAEVATAGGLEKDGNGKLQIKVKTDGGIATDANGAYVAIPVPAYDSSDADRVLTVDDSDGLVWALPPATPIQASDGISISSGSYINIGVSCDSDGGLDVSSSGVAIKHTSSDAGKFLTVNSDNEIEWDVVPDGLPSTTGASSGDVLTFDGTNVDWAAPSGGGSSAPTEITPTWDGMNRLFTVRVPSNNGIFFANLPDKGQIPVEVEVIPPTITSGEIFNFTVVIINDWEIGNDHHMYVNDPYNRISATDEKTQYGNVYGNATTRFVVLGNGYTMFTTGYFSG